MPWGREIRNLEPPILVMPEVQITLQISDEFEAPTRIDTAILKTLRPEYVRLRRKDVQQWVGEGCIQVEGSLVRTNSYKVEAGTQVVILCSEDALEALRTPEPAAVEGSGSRKLQWPKVKPTRELKAADILHVDPYLAMINKPAGLPSDPTRDQSRDHTLAALERALIRDGHPFGRIVSIHRLDLHTSGVLAVSLAKSANRPMTEAFRTRTVSKLYLAACAPELNIPEVFEVKNYLAEDPVRFEKQKRMRSVHSGGSPAHTRFRVLYRGADKTLVACEPLSGRTHQIRVHLGELGAPILGDELYGGTAPTRWKSGYELHAWHLKLPHPKGGAVLQKSAPLPFWARNLEGPKGIEELDPATVLATFE